MDNLTTIILYDNLVIKKVIKIFEYFINDFDVNKVWEESMDKKITQQKDHIILPKATLKRFADEKNNKIAYLALRNKEIKLEEQFSRAFHTSGNYYNPEYD